MFIKKALISETHLPICATNEVLHQVAQRGSTGKVIINFD